LAGTTAPIGPLDGRGKNQNGDIVTVVVWRIGKSPYGQTTPHATANETTKTAAVKRFSSGQQSEHIDCRNV